MRDNDVYNCLQDHFSTCWLGVSLPQFDIAQSYIYNEQNKKYTFRFDLSIFGTHVVFPEKWNSRNLMRNQIVWSYFKCFTVFWHPNGFSSLEFIFRVAWFVDINATCVSVAVFRRAERSNWFRFFPVRDIPLRFISLNLIFSAHIGRSHPIFEWTLRWVHDLSHSKLSAAKNFSGDLLAIKISIFGFFRGQTMYFRVVTLQ